MDDLEDIPIELEEVVEEQTETEELALKNATPAQLGREIRRRKGEIFLRFKLDIRIALTHAVHQLQDITGCSPGQAWSQMISHMAEAVRETKAGMADDVQQDSGFPES